MGKHPTVISQSRKSRGVLRVQTEARTQVTNFMSTSKEKMTHSLLLREGEEAAESLPKVFVMFIAMFLVATVLHG